MPFLTKTPKVKLTNFFGSATSIHLTESPYPFVGATETTSESTPPPSTKQSVKVDKVNATSLDGKSKSSLFMNQEFIMSSGVFILLVAFLSFLS